MRNLKKLLAVIVAICLVATLSVPAFAAESSTYGTQAQTLHDLGLYAGTTTATFTPDLGTALDRQTGVVLLLRVFGLEKKALAMTDAEVTTALTGFTDAATLPDWSKKQMAYAIANKLVAGMTATTIGPKEALNGKMYASLILRQLGFTDAAYDTATTTLAGKGGLTADQATAFATKAMTKDDLVGMTYGALSAKDSAGNTVIANLVAAGVVGKDAAVKAGLVSSNVGISSVTATAADTLSVKLNAAVDTTKAVFTVKSGATTVTMVAPVWSADKTTATLVKSYKFSAGDYTVTLSGIDNIDAANASKTVTLKDQTVTKINIIGKDLVQNAAGTNGTFNYNVQDQYGNDMTKTTTLGMASSMGVISLNASTGVGTVTYNFAANTSVTTVVVTLVDSGTGVTATTSLNVAKSANVADIKFGDIVLPSGTTRLSTGNAAAATIPLTVTDQYGNLIKNTTILANAITVVSSDTTNVHFTFASDTNGNPVLNVDTSTLTSAETVVVTLIVTANGKSYTQSYSIVKPAVADKVILGDPVTSDVIAQGDTGIVLPITAIDQFGNTLSASDTVANAATINGMVSVSGTVISDPVVVTDPNSANYGKMTFDANGGSTGTAMIVSSSTSGVNTKTVSVVDPRKATSVDNLAASNIIQGGNKDLKFVFRDQYGKVMDPPANAGMTYTVALDKISGDTNSVTTAHALAGVGIGALQTINVVTDPALTGSYKVTVNLLDSVTANVLASANTTVNVVKNNVAGLTYSIDAIPTIAGDQNYTAADAWARGITVSAKDAAGVSYTVNSSDIVAVSSSDTSVAKVDLATMKVFGQNISAGTDATKTVTITAKVNTLDGMKAVTQTVTVAKAAPSVTTLKAVAETIAANNSAVAWIQDTLPGDCSDKLTYTALPSAIHLVTKDQYGVWQDIVDPTAVATTVAAFVNSTDLASRNAVELSNTSNIQDHAGAATAVPAGKDVKVTLMLGDGLVQIIIHK